jgi:hypothetical protein
MNDLSNQYSALGFNPGYYDLLILDRVNSTEPLFEYNFGNIDIDFLLNAENLNFSFAQEALNYQRLAGEGADPNTFGLSKADFSASFSMLVKASSSGYIDFGFASLWDAATLAYQGTGNAIAGKIISTNNTVGIGTTYITVDNIGDFKSLTTPFNLTFSKFGGTEISETVSVTSINKTNRALFFSAGTARTHTVLSTFVKAGLASTTRNPTFNLVSLFQGLLSGCLVDKITISAKPGQDIEANIDVKFLNINRQYQIDVNNNFNTLASNVAKYKVYRGLQGSEVRINNTSFTAGGFGLTTNAFGNPFFQGFQGIGTTSFLVQEFTLTLENQLEPVYSLHSIHPDKFVRFRENLKPYALVSNGRKIEGTIKYISPISPYALAEKLAGPSSINNGGIEIDFGVFKITFDEVVWSGSKASSPLSDSQTKEIKFSVVTEKLNKIPTLDNSTSF